MKYAQQSSHANTSVRQCDCPYLIQIDIPLLIPSLSAIRLCTRSSILTNITTTLFEAFLTIRHLRQMETAVRPGSYPTWQQSSFCSVRLEERSLVSSGLDFHQERQHLPLALLPSFGRTFTFVGYSLHRRHRHQLWGMPLSSAVGGRAGLSDILIPLQTLSTHDSQQSRVVDCTANPHRLQRDDDAQSFILYSRSVSFVLTST
jgi:hypothetical protein